MNDGASASDAAMTRVHGRDLTVSIPRKYIESVCMNFCKPLPANTDQPFLGVVCLFRYFVFYVVVGAFFSANELVSHMFY